MYVVFALLGAASYGIGAALMKLGVSTGFPKIAWKDFLRQWRAVVKTVVTNRVWAIGLLLSVASAFFVAQAMSGGDLSVVQILANTASLWSLCVGVAFFSERLAAGEWCGLAIILAGAVLVSLTPESTCSLESWHLSPL
jgi:uncharacterized membrane protein